MADDRFAPHRSFDVRECGSCGTQRTFDGNAPADPKGHYPAEYGAFSAPRAHRPKYRAVGSVAFGRLAWIDRLPVGSSTILDVGCGTGRLSAALVDLGFRVRGLEPSSGAVKVARTRGLDVQCGTIEELGEREKYDVVVLSHVLEHVFDPRAVLEKASRLLTEEGVVVAALPNRRSLERAVFGAHWDGWDVPRHTHHWCPSSVRRLLIEAGLREVWLGFEIYSILDRSAANAGWPAFSRRVLRIGERPLGLILAILGCSGAIQLICRPAR